MNRHRLVDTLSVSSGSLYGKRIHFFREGLQSQSVMEVPAALEVELSPSSEEGDFRVPVRFLSLEGVARYSLIHWAGGDRPSLIYHHGSGETEYTARIRRILPMPIRSRINLIAVSVPFNHSLKEYLHGIGHLERFVFLLASSVRLTECLGDWLRAQGTGRIVVSGISLGGWITNLHFSLYGRMDEYRPIFAGAALDHLFTDTVYRKLTSREARDNPEVLRQALNFEAAFQSRDNQIVFPLLARHDHYIRFERQRRIYADSRLSVLEKGHITGSMDTKSLRAHLLRGLRIDQPASRGSRFS